MLATQKLHDLGQSLWLDDITRDLLDSGKLAKYIDEWSVTGLTSNPSIFNQAIGQSKDYDADISALLDAGQKGEDLFFEVALQDLRRAADLFAKVHQRTATVDGWVSLEVSPLIAHDTAATIASAKALHAKADRANLFIKIPGTTEGLPAIEEAIFNGVPINVTLLFSAEQYLNAANAYIRGLERRVEAGLSPDVRSVASIFVSRWDKAVAEKLPASLANQLGIAIATMAYKAYRDLQASDRWQRLENLGARPQRLLFASTGTKDPKAVDTLYIGGLAAPNTVNTMPEKTLRAVAEHGSIEKMLPYDGVKAEKTLQAIRDAGIDDTALATQLQIEGAESFVKSWQELLQVIEGKTHALR